MLVSGNTQIEPGDSVMVFCHNINMKKIEILHISVKEIETYFIYDKHKINI